MPADFAKLRWRCRRGMRELDAVLQSFLASASALEEKDLSRFEAILDLPDPELFAYLTGRSVPQDPATAFLIERIRASHQPRT